jgi:serine/threonine-protein kinase
MGVILGTAAYMSPEQARGRTLDKRTDIWAFGAVLYEMLTGARAFAGDDITDVIAEVVKTTPNWTALPTDVPPHVVTLIQRCLEKDRNARIGDMAVARFLLTGHATSITSPAPSVAVASAPAPRRRHTIPLVLAALLAGALIGWVVPRRPAGAPPVTHLQMSVQPADHLSGSVVSGTGRPPRTAMALSPNGRLVVFSGTRGAVTQLYVRELDRADAAPIPGTENAVAPFLSPDARWVGFVADSKLRKVPLAGGPSVVISDVPAPGISWGSSWGEDGTILFASNAGISRVSSDGGTASPLSKPDASKGEQRHVLPQWLPGGKAFLFTVKATDDWDTANVVVQAVDGGERRVLIQGAADARYVDTGHVVFMKSGTLTAAPFDVRSHQVTGAAVPVLENVMQGINAGNGNNETGAGQFALSAAGTLFYVVGGINPSRQDTVVWVDRKGNIDPLTAMAGGAKPTLFLESRFTLWYPEFSPDGHWIAYTSNESGTPELYVRPYPGPGEKIRISTVGGLEPIWTANGRELVFRSGTFERLQFFAATIRTVSPFQADAPRLLFDATAGTYDNSVPVRSWDVRADGQRFLLLRPVASTDKPVTVMHVVLNWGEELKRLVPAK